jgi:hypothetical protein
VTETTPLAPSTAEAAVANERLATWIIGALTAIVIGGVAIVIYGPHGGARGRVVLASRDQRLAEHRNATAEGLNSKIQWIRYTARGFRNRENFKTAIYFHCGGLDLYPH